MEFKQNLWRVYGTHEMHTRLYYEMEWMNWIAERVDMNVNNFFFRFKDTGEAHLSSYVT
jgi:hypothetical protein